MTSVLATWNDLLERSSDMLVILNVQEGDLAAAGAFFDRLGAKADSSSLWVVAEMLWLPWLEAHGVAPERVLAAADDAGQPLELNHFLESPVALQWVRSRHFEAVVGVSPHSLHNDEVKLPFEERLCLFVGHAKFVAHTLPHDYLYIFDLPTLIGRCGRALKTEEYRATCRAVVDQWHQQWQADGQPASSDDTNVSPLMAILACHWEGGVLLDDEGRSAGERIDTVDVSIPAVEYLQSVVAERDDRLDELQRRFDDTLNRYQERAQATEVREALLAESHAERVQAVNLRDEIIDDLRGRRLKERIRRVFRRR